MKKTLFIFFYFFVIMVLPAMAQENSTNELPDNIKLKIKIHTWGATLFGSYEKYYTKPNNVLQERAGRANLPNYNNYGYSYGVLLERINIQKKVGLYLAAGFTYDYKGEYYYCFKSTFFSGNSAPARVFEPKEYYRDKYYFYTIPVRIGINYKINKKIILTAFVGIQKSIFGSLKQKEYNIKTDQLISEKKYEIKDMNIGYNHWVLDNYLSFYTPYAGLKINYKMTKKICIQYSIQQNLKQIKIDENGTNVTNQSDTSIQIYFLYNYDKFYFTSGLGIYYSF